MRAMILAAGRGQRMRELTNTVPKALLRVGKRYLIEYALFSLCKAGIEEVIINTCHHAEKIEAALGDGSQYQLNITYSREAEALETGGGIVKALPFFKDEAFLVLSADVICDYPIKQLLKEPQGLAHLVLVNNPDFHSEGDFSLQNGLISMEGNTRYTFANIGVYRPELFAESKIEKFPLRNVLRPQVASGQISGEVYDGFWQNVGTPEQLSSLNSQAIL